jgi:hypothetical protein
MVVVSSPGLTTIAAAAIAVGGIALGGRVASGARRIEPRVRPTRAGPRRGVLEATACAMLLLGVLTASWNGVRPAPGLTISDPFLVGALAAWLLARRGVIRDLGKAPWWIVGGAYVLSLAIGMSEIVGTGGVTDAFPGLRLLVVMCFVPAVVGTISNGAGITVAVAMAWVFGVALNGAVGVLDSSFGTSVGTSVTHVESADRVAGLTTQANHLAVASAMALPFAVSLLLSLKGALARVAVALSMAVIVLGCLASGSRAGLAGLACTAIMLAWTQRRSFGRTLRVGVVGVVVIILALSWLPGDRGSIAIDRALGRSNTALGVVQSDRTRTLYRDQAIERFWSSPLFGTGFAEFRRAHSVYLQLLAAGGLCALIAFLIFLGGGIRTGLWLARGPDIPVALAGLAGAAATALAAWGVMGLLSNQIFDRYLFVPVGILWAVRARQERVAEARASVGTRVASAPGHSPELGRA